MIFKYGRVVGRRRIGMEDDYFFEWRPGRHTGPSFRDLSWDFEEPDQYPALVAAQKPGMMAPKGEKAMHTAVSSGDPGAILKVGAENPNYLDAARTIAGLLLLESELERAMALLSEVATSGANIGKDHFLRKYLPEAGLTVVIAAGLVVHLPLLPTSLILLLAELHQARDEKSAALELLNQAEPTSHIRLSQTELLFESGDFDGVVAKTNGVVNDDDVTALMLAYRGRALAELGRHDEAIGVLARSLEYPNRAESVKAIALVGRGMIYQARGENMLAENDFNQALIEVPNDEEARRHIEELIREGSADT